MYKIIIALFISALMFGCQDAEEAVSTADTDKTEEAFTVKDKVSDSEYSKKYGSAMKKAMSAAKGGADTASASEMTNDDTTGEPESE